MLLKNTRTNMDYQLEEEIQDILVERFTSPAPTSFEEFFKKVVFNKEYVNEYSLKEILQYFDYKNMTNINRIYILAIDDLSDYQEELIDCDIDGMLFSGVLGIHNVKSGNVVVCLDHHDNDDLNHFDQSFEVILTALHEIGHAVQMSESHIYFFEAVEFIRYVNDYELLEEDSIEILEKDAERYAHRNMRKIESNFDFEDDDSVFKNLIDWAKLEF